MLAIAPVDDAADALCRKRKITPAAEAISVSCAYQEPEAEEEERSLHSLRRVKYVCSTPSDTVGHWILAARALHAGECMCIPWELKLPLFASSFPAAITQRQLVPAMRDRGRRVPRGSHTEDLRGRTHYHICPSRRTVR